MEILAYITFVGLLAISWCAIANKAGYRWWYGLFIFVPILNIILLISFAARKWPILNELEQLKATSCHTSEHRLQKWTEDEGYEIVSRELKNNLKKDGLWIKAEISAGGRPDEQRRKYIELRLQQIIDGDPELQDKVNEQKPSIRLDSIDPAKEAEKIVGTAFNKYR